MGKTRAGVSQHLPVPPASGFSAQVGLQPLLTYHIMLRPCPPSLGLLTPRTINTSIPPASPDTPSQAAALATILFCCPHWAQTPASLGGSFFQSSSTEPPNYLASGPHPSEGLEGGRLTPCCSLWLCAVALKFPKVLNGRVLKVDDFNSPEKHQV